MNDWLPIDIASSGMAAERIRMNALASNLANASSTRTPEGGPYQPLDIVFRAQPKPSFHAELESRLQSLLGESFSLEDQGLLERHLRGVGVEVVKSSRAPEMRYEPGHPDADEKGMVAYPAISPIEQMTNMIAASRLYEANSATIKMTKEMLQEALDVLR